MKNYKIVSSKIGFANILSGILSREFECIMNVTASDNYSYLLDIQRIQKEENDHPLVQFALDFITKKFVEEEAEGCALIISLRTANYVIALWLDDKEEYELGEMYSDICTKINDHFGSLDKCVTF